jgi:hypothetical protein
MLKAGRNMSPTRMVKISFLMPLFLAAGSAVTVDGQTSIEPSLSEIRIVSPTDGETFRAPADILVMIEGTDIPNVRGE